jgi:hypothetical protein
MAELAARPWDREWLFKSVITSAEYKERTAGCPAPVLFDAYRSCSGGTRNPPSPRHSPRWPSPATQTGWGWLTPCCDPTKPTSVCDLALPTVSWAGPLAPRS